MRKRKCKCIKLDGRKGLYYALGMGVHVRAGQTEKVHVRTFEQGLETLHAYA